MIKKFSNHLFLSALLAITISCSKDETTTKRDRDSNIVFGVYDLSYNADPFQRYSNQDSLSFLSTFSVRSLAFRVRENNIPIADLYAKGVTSATSPIEVQLTLKSGSDIETISSKTAKHLIKNVFSLDDMFGTIQSDLVMTIKNSGAAKVNNDTLEIDLSKITRDTVWRVDTLFSVPVFVDTTFLDTVTIDPGKFVVNIKIGYTQNYTINYNLMYNASIEATYVSKYSTNVTETVTKNVKCGRIYTGGIPHVRRGVLNGAIIIHKD